MFWPHYGFHGLSHLLQFSLSNILPLFAIAGCSCQPVTLYFLILLGYGIELSVLLSLSSAFYHGLLACPTYSSGFFNKWRHSTVKFNNKFYYTQAKYKPRIFQDEGPSRIMSSSHLVASVAHCSAHRWTNQLYYVYICQLLNPGRIIFLVLDFCLRSFLC